MCEGIGIGVCEYDFEGLILEWLRGEERGLGFECKGGKLVEGDVAKWTRGRGELGNGDGLVCLGEGVDVGLHFG